VILETTREHPADFDYLEGQNPDQIQRGLDDLIATAASRELNRAIDELEPGKASFTKLLKTLKPLLAGEGFGSKTSEEMRQFLAGIVGRKLEEKELDPGKRLLLQSLFSLGHLPLSKKK